MFRRVEDQFFKGDWRNEMLSFPRISLIPVVSQVYLSTFSEPLFCWGQTFSPATVHLAGERSRGKCSCLKEKEKGRKATLRLNTRAVLKPLPKERRKLDYKYHRNPCLWKLLHNHKSWEWTVNKNCVLLKWISLSIKNNLLLFMSRCDVLILDTRYWDWRD